METANKTANAGIGALVQSMLGERFAQKNHFGEMNLETLGKAFEEFSQGLDATGDAGEQAAEKASYEKCFGLYCEMLMALELQGQSLPTTALSTLVAAPVMVAVPDELMVAAPVEAASSAADDPTFTVAAEEAVLGLTSPTTRDPFSVTVAAVALGEPANETSALSSCLSSSTGREHLELAHYFERLKDNRGFPFSAHHINRLIDQSLCFCLEAECADKFSGVMTRFWPGREDAIKTLLNPSAKRVELQDALKTEIDTLASAHPEWLLEGRFPYASALTALRYIVATQVAEKYFGSLLDYGLMLLLFGQAKALDGLKLKNILGAEGLEADSLVEVAFRLSRLHKLRNKVVSATSRLSEQHRLLLQEDVHALIMIMAKLTFPGSAAAKKVA